MNARQLRKYRSIQRSVRLLRVENVKGPEYEPLIKDLEKTLKRVAELIPAQKVASKRRTGWADVIAGRRVRLREVHMFRISRRGPALMGWAPGAEVAFAMPRADASIPTLVGAARAMIKVVARKPSLFTKEAAFPKGFLAAFRADLSDLEQAVAGAEDNTSQLSQLTAEMEERIRHGRAQLRVLDGLLKPLSHGNKVFREKWEEAWIIPPVLGRPKKKNKKKKKDGEGDQDEDEEPAS